MARPEGYAGWLDSQTKSGPPEGYYGWLESTRRKHKAPFHPPKGQITFTGYGYDNAEDSRSFNTLAGDTPPTIVGGHVAKLNTIDRPLRRGLTVFAGYDPPSMDVSLRFIQFDEAGRGVDDEAGESILTKIEALEWMGGHGLTHGTPPIVYVTTYDNGGNTIPLVPFNWQIADTPDVPAQFRDGLNRPWFVQAIAWDQSPDLNAGGYRINQKVTVTLVEYEGLTGSAPTSAALRNRTSTGKAGVFHATEAFNTPQKIAGAPSNRSRTPDREALALAILRDPANKHLHLRSVNSKIKKGAVVHIPGTVL